MRNTLMIWNVGIVLLRAVQLVYAINIKQRSNVQMKTEKDVSFLKCPYLNKAAQMKLIPMVQNAFAA